jgi:hypothetical protein
MATQTILPKIKIPKRSKAKKTKRQHPEAYARQRVKTRANKVSEWRNHIAENPNDRQNGAILTRLITREPSGKKAGRYKRNTMEYLKGTEVSNGRH